MFLYWFWWVLAGGAEGEGDFGGQSFVQIGVFLLLIVFVFFFYQGDPRDEHGGDAGDGRQKIPRGFARACRRR